MVTMSMYDNDEVPPLIVTNAHMKTISRKIHAHEFEKIIKHDCLIALLCGVEKLAREYVRSASQMQLYVARNRVQWHHSTDRDNELIPRITKPRTLAAVRGDNGNVCEKRDRAARV